MDSTSDEEGPGLLPNDEVREIKRAMRVAKARKQAISQQMKSKLDRNSADQCELESILRKQGGELNRTKTQLSQMDFDLKEARFEMNQMLERENALKEEKRIMDAKNAETISDLRNQLDIKTRSHEERTQIALFECDKMVKTLSSLYKSVFDGRNASATTAPKTTKQLLDKATRDAEHLREFLQSKSSGLLNEEQEHVTSFHNKNHQIKVENGTDTELLDMCRSLEEENHALSDTVEALRAQLAEASRDVAINRLIPHYRLAIVRSRTYAANLLEQIKREQATSQSLREQLDATYADLKKVVEEKRALFTRMSKYSLQLEERESYQGHQRGVDEQRILRAADDRERRTASPLHHHAQPQPPATTARRASSPSSAPSKVAAEASSSDAEKRPTGSAATRVQSRYLQSLQEGDSAVRPAARVAEEVKQPELPSNSSLHLKSELSQLDKEIEELKTKLGKAAMLKSQRILSEVLDAHVPR